VREAYRCNGEGKMALVRPDLYVDYVGSINDSRRTVRTCATALADIAARSKRIEMADDFTSIACFVKMERL
jgi:hypothetical protein